MKRLVLCRYGAPDAAGRLAPSIWQAVGFRALINAGCSAYVYSPPATTLAEGVPCLVELDVPDALAPALATQIAALDNGSTVRVLPNLRGAQTLTGGQRTTVRNILNAFSVDGAAAAASSTDFGDFIRYVVVTAWQHAEFDKARIT